MSIDPVTFLDTGEPSQFNRYMYANNDPVNMFDPDGRNSEAGHQRLADAARSHPRELAAVGAAGLVGGIALVGAAEMAVGMGLVGASEFAAGMIPGMEGATLTGSILAAGAKIANEVPGTLARVIGGDVAPTTLARTGQADAFVTAADDIAGMNASQISEALTIPSSSSMTVIEFPSAGQAIESPVNRTNPGFVDGGQTAGGAREFVVPNQPIPDNATRRVVE